METINEIIDCSSNALLGYMKFEEYQKDMIVAIFYKYLSFKIEKECNKQLFKYNINFEEAFTDENIEFYGNNLRNQCLNNLGFFIEPENLYQNIISNKDILKTLDDAVKSIEFKDDSLNDLFSNIKFTNLNVINEVSELFEGVLININSLTFKNNDCDEFNDLMKYFMKKSYTPPEVSLLINKLVDNDYFRNKDIINIYDGTCGSCSTLIKLNNINKHVIYYGQEVNTVTFNMARMNMIMHDISPDNFHIFNEDVITSNHVLPQMDIIVSHLPILKKDLNRMVIEKMFKCLDDNGIMVIIVNQSILSRTGEKDLRQEMINNNYIDAIIELPKKVFYRNRISSIMILKKNRKINDEILFIDASNNYRKEHPLNILVNLDDIINLYQSREKINDYSYLAGVDEVIDNDYSLNIKLYVNRYTVNRVDVNDSLVRIDELSDKIHILNDRERKLINIIKDIN